MKKLTAETLEIHPPKSSKLILSILFFFVLSLASFVRAESSPGGDNDCELSKKIYSAYEAGDFGSIKKICSKNKRTVPIFATGKLLLYLGDKVSAKEFIDAFPKNKEEYFLLADVPFNCGNPAPKIFVTSRSEGIPIYTFFEELSKLMEKGDRRAIRKVLLSIPWVDGDMAEMLLWETLPNFLFNHPDIVLKNWDLFKNHLDRVDASDYSEKVYQDLVHLKEVVQATPAGEGSKKDFLKYLEKEIEKHKKYFPSPKKP
jgi:hypothetical protein